MEQLFCGIIFLGITLLLASLPATLQICRKSSHLAWYTLFNFIILFIIGYFGVAYYFFTSSVNINIVYIVSCILFGGGGFVFLVTRLSYSSILTIERAVEEQRYQALHDSLTGLPNRKMFFNSLSHYISKGIPCSVLFIDLNDFKQVNDSFGHHIGDQLLIVTAKTLQQHLIQPSSLARIGGDEFAVLFIHQSEFSFKQCMSKIENAIRQPLKIEQQYIRVNLSVGASNYPQDSEQVDTLIKYADLAMYEAKKSRKLFVCYTPALGKKAHDTLLVASKLKAAIENEQLTLFYQPIISTEENKASGFEALIRWPQDDGSIIFPDQFIPIAEQTNLIVMLTKWVVTEAVKDLTYLRENGFNGTIHLNISAQDLQSNEFSDHVVELFSTDTSICDFITFEITESAMMTNIDKAREMINLLSCKGFAFSIDDFGTGFSSLQLLRELPIDQIKIDRSFITNMLDRSADFAIVESIIFLANKLGCDVVAEGIENSTLEKLLLKLGCNYLQGYYYSKPASLFEVAPQFINELKAIQ